VGCQHPSASLLGARGNASATLSASLLSGGLNTYTYDGANRLTSLSNPLTVSSYRYNGLGDRLRETVNGGTTTFVMDLNSGLTQALSDGTNAYLYGVDRIAQSSIADPQSDTEYFLGDALGSVRQLADVPKGDAISGAVVLAQAYDPYGVTAYASGAAQSAYGFTAEYTSAAAGLIYLRARQYDPSVGRFTSRDTWGGNFQQPITLNKYVYGLNNPVLYMDPSGQRCIAGLDVDWLGGDKCTEAERQQAAQTMAYLRGFIDIRNFALGFEYEFLTSMTVANPETFAAAYDLLMHTRLGQTIRDSSNAMAVMTVGLLCQTGQFQNIQNSPMFQVYSSLINAANTLRGDYYFQTGRVYARLLTIAMGVGIAAAGVGSIVSSKPTQMLLVAAGGPSGGTTIAIAGAIEAVNVWMAAYGVLVVGSIALREWSDKLLGRYFSGEIKPGGGSGGGGGGGSVQQAGGDPGRTIFTARGPDGRLVWLEEGDAESGLEHIIERHGSDFAARGISADRIPDALKTALDEGSVLGYNGDGVIYQFNYAGRT
jgi:RHS repeat-associated protein